MPRLHVAVVVAFFLAACSTTYKPGGFGGGYTDIPLALDTVGIDVRGNGYTDRATVGNIALVRAADLAIQNGYSRFVILDTDATTTQRFGGYLPGTVQSTTQGQATIAGNSLFGTTRTTGTITPATPLIVNNDRVSLVVRFIRDYDPDTRNALVAKDILRRLGPSVGYKG